MKEQILKKEEKFHDHWAAGVDLEAVHPVHFFEACTAPENRWIKSKLGNMKGKKILELGCGFGEGSVYFAMQGADVTASDLSEGMLDVAEKVAEYNHTHIKTVKCSADNLPFQDESFDIVYAANMLHHVDLERTLQEASRVLKRGGIFASIDPLAHNPIINIYRRMASEVRTEDEHPLKMKEIKTFKKYFSKITCRASWFFTLIVFLKYYFIDHVDLRERYWRKILDESQEIEGLYCKLEKLDIKILKIFPFLKKYCWNISVVCKK